MMVDPTSDPRWSEMMAKMNKKPVIPIRIIICLISLLSTGLAYATRANLSVTIVPMVPNRNITAKQMNSTEIDNKYTFDWTKSEEGLVLGAYYYGYTGANIIAGRLCERVNVVYLTALAHVVSTITTLLTPIAAQGGLAVIFLIRFIHGISHGPILSALYVLFNRWFPKPELGTALSSIFVGANLGVVLIMPFSAYLCRLKIWGGWPLAYYALGMLNIIFIGAWLAIVTSDPTNHPWITEYELRMIQKEACSTERCKVVKVNWYKLWTSKKLWAITIAQGACGFGYMVVSTKIPAYLEESLNVPLEANGFINSYLFIAITATMIVSGPLSDWIISKGILSVTRVRKLFETGTLLIPAICLLLIPLIGYDQTEIIILLIIAMLGLGLMTGGETPMVSEMAPDLSGTVFGICNTAASAGGFTAPLIIGFILDSQESEYPDWDYVFFLTAAIMISGWTYFLIYGSAKPQAWGTAPNRANSIVTVVSIEMHEVSRFRLWFERKKQRLSQATLVYKY